MTKKYSDAGLASSSPLTGTEKFGITQAGVSKYCTPAIMATYIGSGVFIGGQSKLASTQTISNNTATNISFDTENWDTDTMIDIGGNPTRITIATDGRYDVKFWGYFASNATGIRYAAIYYGGATLIGVDSMNAVNGTITGLNPHATLDLVAGNYLEIKVFQTSGGNLTVAGVFDVHKID